MTTMWNWYSEMMARYSDEWIFFEVVEDDRYEQPYKGRLIAHSPDRDEIHRIVMERKDVYHSRVVHRSTGAGRRPGLAMSFRERGFI